MEVMGGKGEPWEAKREKPGESPVVNITPHWKAFYKK